MKRPSPAPIRGTPSLCVFFLYRKKNNYPDTSAKVPTYRS